MFKALTTLQNILKKPVTEIAENTSLQVDLSTYQSVKNEKENDQLYSDFLRSGMAELTKFYTNTDNVEDITILESAAEKFTESLQIKKNQPEPYFYLGFIFYLLNETSYSLLYLKVVTSLNPLFPGLEKLKTDIILNMKKPIHSSNTLNSKILH